jgi:hypothetical protein
MGTYCFLLTGGWGSGKSVMALSYHPKNNKAPKRLVIDKEVRSIRYQAEENGYDRDIPEALLFSFDLYPDNTGVIGAEQFAELVRKFKKGQNPDVLVIENMAMFQEDITSWCQTAEGTRKVLEGLDMVKQHESFLKYRFSQDPYWRNLLKQILREFLLVAKRANTDIVITTELRNEWQNYGAKGYDKDGNPKQRIIGKTAKVWDYVLQIADTCWLLSRNIMSVTDKPLVSIDPLNPKLSIVGVPPQFTFNSWDQIWEWEKRRGVVSKEAFERVQMPEPEYRDGDPDTEAGDPMELGKQRLIDELGPYYKDRNEIGRALSKLGIPYTLDMHDTIRDKLIELKQ